jgi:hypothetical protein
MHQESYEFDTESDLLAFSHDNQCPRHETVLQLLPDMLFSLH